jgi:hypothetical protein
MGLEEPRITMPTPGEIRTALLRCQSPEALRVMKNFLQRLQEENKRSSAKGKRTMAERKRRLKNECHF